MKGKGISFFLVEFQANGWHMCGYARKGGLVHLRWLTVISLILKNVGSIIIIHIALHSQDFFKGHPKNLSFISLHSTTYCCISFREFFGDETHSCTQSSSRFLFFYSLGSTLLREWGSIPRRTNLEFEVFSARTTQDRHTLCWLLKSISMKNRHDFDPSVWGVTLLIFFSKTYWFSFFRPCLKN